MNWNPDIRKSPPGRAALVVGALLLVAGLAMGLHPFRHKPSGDRLKPQEARESIVEYLHRKSGRNQFKPVLDFTREKNPWAVMKQQYDTASDYKTVYRIIGEHLMVADQFLAGTNTSDLPNGLRLGMDLTDVALDTAADDWLATQICDSYLLSNLGRIPDKPKRGPTQNELVQFATKVFTRTEAHDKQIRLYKDLLGKPTAATRPDAIRLRLADELATVGDLPESIKYLKEIRDPGLTNASTRRLLKTEQKLKSQQN